MRKSVHGSTVPGTRKRVIRSAHPGVVLIPPDPAHNHPTWRARFIDPDKGRPTKERLDPLALRTAEARRGWAIRKARALAKRAMEIESGAPRATGGALSAGIDRYYKAHAQLRANTLSSYKSATDKLLEWAAANGVKSGDDLTRAKLLGFREELIAEPKRAAAKKAKRGARRATAVRRSAYSVNRELRGIRVVLGYLAELDLLTKIREGDLRRALKKLPITTEEADFLKPAELAALLEAALAHDADKHTETREGHRGLRPLGSTPRFEPVAPFIAMLVLGGMRLGEAVSLEWQAVDLHARGLDGQEVGELHLSGEKTKTKRSRVVDLSVSPMLRDLLLAMEKVRGDGALVFGLTYDGAAAAVKRLKKNYGAPARFGYQVLRSTCGTFLTNSPGIFGAASAYRSARQLGHSVSVAEKHYLGLIRIAPDARDLETAMQIKPLLERVIAAAGAAPAKAQKLA
jgi:integrase